MSTAREAGVIFVCDFSVAAYQMTSLAPAFSGTFCDTAMNLEFITLLEDYTFHEWFLGFQCLTI